MLFKTIFLKIVSVIRDSEKKLSADRDPPVVLTFKAVSVGVSAPAFADAVKAEKAGGYTGGPRIGCDAEEKGVSSEIQMLPYMDCPGLGEDFHAGERFSLIEGNGFLGMDRGPIDPCDPVDHDETLKPAVDADVQLHGFTTRAQF